MPSILIAEVDPSVRTLLCHVLERDGHEVVAACDADDALTQAYLLCPDLFLCDVSLAEVDGREALGPFRAAFPNVPVVAMSGAAWGGRLDLLGVAWALGADRVLAKPFTVAELLALVEELLPVAWGCAVG
jgi:CheY-like chemotaxis protein